MGRYSREAYLEEKQKPQPICVRPAKRKCLSCGKTFKSAGIHNRICKPCKLPKREMNCGPTEAPCHCTPPELQPGTYW